MRTWVAIAATLGFAACLSQLVIDRSGALDAAANLHGLIAWFWIPFAIAWVALTVLPKPMDRNPWAFSCLIIAVALIARLFVVFTTTPQLSDDIWRYIHDGQTLAAGESPYAFAPDEVEHADDRINHPHLVTIYQPTSQWTFAALATVHDAIGGAWDLDGDRTFRLGFVLFDLCIVMLLLRKLRDVGRSPWFAAMYAWHPLAIAEVAGSGHQDVIGIALLLGTLLLFERRRMLLCGIALALAVAVKPIVAPIALPLAWAMRRERAALACVFIGGVMGMIVLYVPFVLMPPGLSRLGETVDAFVGTWAFNGSIHALATWLLDKVAADRIAAGLSVVVLLVVTWRCDLWRAAMVWLFASLLLSSTAHPWYLLWALAFVPIAFSEAAWVWSATIVLSYFVLRDVNAWHLSPWVAGVEYVPVYGMLMVELLRHVWNAICQVPYAKCRMPNERHGGAINIRH
jgi:hypothetical protein